MAEIQYIRSYQPRDSVPALPGQMARKRAETLEFWGITLVLGSILHSAASPESHGRGDR